VNSVGSPGAFTEQALRAKMAELASIRSEIKSVQDQIVFVKTGRRVEKIRPTGSKVPGGVINVPVVGSVPALVIAGAAVVAVVLLRR